MTLLRLFLTVQARRLLTDDPLDNEEEISIFTVIDDDAPLPTNTPAPSPLPGEKWSAPEVLDDPVLVTLELVCYGGQPRLAADSETAPRTAFTVVDGRLALVDSRFGDDRFGWALVRQRRDLCSTQTVVTAATAYRQYLTPEALQRAAASYGGLTAL